MVIIKSFGSTTKSDISGGGTKIRVSWETLLPYLDQIIKLRPKEEIGGFVADEDGLNIHINNRIEVPKKYGWARVDMKVSITRMDISKGDIDKRNKKREGTITDINGAYIYVKPKYRRYVLELYLNEIKQL